MSEIEKIGEEFFKGSLDNLTFEDAYEEVFSWVTDQMSEKVNVHLAQDITQDILEYFGFETA